MWGIQNKSHECVTGLNLNEDASDSRTEGDAQFSNCVTRSHLISVISVRRLTLQRNSCTCNKRTTVLMRQQWTHLKSMYRAGLFACVQGDYRVCPTGALPPGGLAQGCAYRRRTPGPYAQTVQSSPHFCILDGADFSGAQMLKKFPAFLRSTMVHHGGHMVHPLFKTLSRLNAINILFSYLSNIHFNIVVPSILFIMFAPYTGHLSVSQI